MKVLFGVRVGGTVEALGRGERDTLEQVEEVLLTEGEAQGEGVLREVGLVLGHPEDVVEKLGLAVELFDGAPEPLGSGLRVSEMEPLDDLEGRACVPLTQEEGDPLRDAEEHAVEDGETRLLPVGKAVDDTVVDWLGEWDTLGLFVEDCVTLMEAVELWEVLEDEETEWDKRLLPVAAQVGLAVALEATLRLTLGHADPVKDSVTELVPQGVVLSVGDIDTEVDWLGEDDTLGVKFELRVTAGLLVTLGVALVQRVALEQAEVLGDAVAAALEVGLTLEHMEALGEEEGLLEALAVPETLGLRVIEGLVEALRHCEGVVETLGVLVRVAVTEGVTRGDREALGQRVALALPLVQCVEEGEGVALHEGRGDFDALGHAVEEGESLGHAVGVGVEEELRQREGVEDWEGETLGLAETLTVEGAVGLVHGEELAEREPRGEDEAEMELETVTVVEKLGETLGEEEALKSGVLDADTDPQAVEERVAREDTVFSLLGLPVGDDERLEVVHTEKLGESLGERDTVRL